MQAKDLNKDLFGSTDPFVQLVLCKKHNDTSVIEFLKTPTVKKVIFCLSITLVLPKELHSFFFENVTLKLLRAVVFILFL